MKTLKIIILVLLLSAEIKAQQWYQMGNIDTNFFDLGRRYVQKIVNYENKITIGGYLKKTSTSTLLNGVAQWNNGNWQPMGLGVWYPLDFSMETNDSAGNGGGGLTEFRGEFYSAGIFFGAGGNVVDLTNTPHIVNRMAKWNGSDWFPIMQPGDGVDDGVMDMIVYHDNLYIGGGFGHSHDTSGWKSTTGISRWNDTVFSPVGVLHGNFPPNGDYAVMDFCEFQNKLIVGGWFSSINLSPFGSYSGIASWDGSNWGHLGNGFNNCVASIVVYNGELYASGMFTSTLDSTTQLNHVAKWDGTNWLPVGEGLGVSSSFTDSVMVLYVDSLQNKLYAGGNFTQTGLGAPAKHLAEWTGTHWQEVGGGTNNKVLTMYAKDSTLYVGGFFTEVGGWMPAHFIAAWGYHPVGVQEIKMDESGVAIYPNPTTNEITLLTTNTQPPTSIHIYNVLGECMLHQQPTTNNQQLTIDISGFAKGVYFVEVQTEKGVMRKKFVKE